MGVDQGRGVALAVALKTKTANVGRCGGMHCLCGGFVRGREVAGWLICAGCGHTQQVHARIEVAA